MSLNFDLRTVLYCVPMPGWRSFFRSGSLTSCGLCFLMLCVTPYLLDVAIVKNPPPRRSINRR